MTKAHNPPPLAWDHQLVVRGKIQMLPGTTTTFELNRCPGCGEPVGEPEYMFCKPCGLFNIRVDSRMRNRADKTVVFNHYGWSCVCCGATEDLTIDHINGNGKEHRESDPSASKLNRWLVEHNFPAGFQTMCRPCNSSKWRLRSCRLVHLNVTINVNVTGWEVLAA